MSIKTSVSVIISFCVACILVACGGGDNWERMAIDGATVSFEMPKPIKMNEDPKEGSVVYVSQEGKRSFKVGIMKRNYQQDQAQGLSDQQVLRNFATRILQASQQQFQQMGLNTQFQHTGSIQVPTGIGEQFQGQVGKATVLNRFYVNQQGLYWVELISQNPQDPDNKRFLDSFKP